MKWYAVYCGNLACLSRTTNPPTLFDVADEQLVDGEPFLCPACSKRKVKVQ